MNRLGLLTAVLAIVALPTGLLGGPKHEKPIKLKNKEVKEKSAPAPAALVLIGVAAGIAGLVRREERRRRTREQHP
jgi:hypothetical protein